MAGLDGEQIAGWDRGVETTDRGPWSQAHSGKRFYPLDPRPEELDLDDIAHHLSQVNRFAGAAKYPYSVAQHTILCVQLCDHIYAPVNVHPASYAAWAHHTLLQHVLLHDAPEYMLGDVIRPVKKVLPAYDELEYKLMQVIVERYIGPSLRLIPQGPERLKIIDDLACATEAAVLLPNKEPWAGFPPPYEGFAHLVARMAPEDAARKLRKLFRKYLGE